MGVPSDGSLGFPFLCTKGLCCSETTKRKVEWRVIKHGCPLWKHIKAKRKWEQTHPEIHLSSHSPRATQDHPIWILVFYSHRVMNTPLSRYPSKFLLWCRPLPQPFVHICMDPAQSPGLFCNTLLSPHSSERPLRGRARVQRAGGITSNFPWEHLRVGRQWCFQPAS